MLIYERQTSFASVTSSETIWAGEIASLPSSRGFKPSFSKSSESKAAAASSNGVRPPMQTTAPSASHPGARSPGSRRFRSFSCSSISVKEAKPPADVSEVPFWGPRCGSKSLRFSITSLTVVSMRSRISSSSSPALSVMLRKLQCLQSYFIKAAHKRLSFFNAILQLIGRFAESPVSSRW